MKHYDKVLSKSYEQISCWIKWRIKFLFELFNSNKHCCQLRIDNVIVSRITLPDKANPYALDEELFSIWYIVINEF